jgi:hypothetical protein
MTTNLAYAYAADITKTERDPVTGDLFVYGKATGADLDLDGQRCDPAWLKSAMPDWFEWANVREMHQPVAAGVGVELLEQGDDWYVKSLVVDPGTANRIEKKVLKGYSIGINSPHITVRDGQEWIVGGNICEISYVDRPCNPTAKLAICKMAGGNEAHWEPAEVEPASDEVTISVGATKFSPADLAKLVSRKNTTAVAEPDAETVTEVVEDVVVEQTAAVVEPVLVEEPAVAAPEAVVSDVEPGPVVDAPAVEPVTAVVTEPVGAAASDVITFNGASVDSKTFLDALTATLNTFQGTDEEKAAVARSEQLVKLYGLTPAEVAEIPENVQVLLVAKGAMPPLKPGGKPRYPIDSVQDLKDAILAFGRGKDSDKDKIQAHIKSEAKRLGQSALIPDDWKAVLAELVKADGENTAESGGGAGSELTHDPAELAAIRDSLVAVIKAELDELRAGQPELCDVDQLLCSLSMFLRWWQGEARGGETTSPYVEPDSDGVEVVEVYLAATSDATKSESPVDTKTTAPTPGTDEQNRLTELVKSAVAAATKTSEERIQALEADLQKALSLPEPGGPVITRTATQAAVARVSDAVALRKEAEALLSKAADVQHHDARLADGYRVRAAELIAKADK